MNDFDLICMKKTIDSVNKIQTTKLKVGAVLVIDDKNIVTCTSSKNCSSDWVKRLKAKILNIGITHASCLYLTINTLSKDDDFDLNGLLKIIYIEKIYIGMPDPKLHNYKTNDPILLLNNVVRYPDNLQVRIFEQNFINFSISKQNIRYNPYYSDVRISKLVQEKLAKYGIYISKADLKKNKSFEKLSDYIKKEHNLSDEKTYSIVDEVISKAFNDKYSSYDYHYDSRFVEKDWAKHFRYLVKSYIPDGMVDKNIINVGIGSGNEAKELFSDCKNIIFVDIAKDGLEKLRTIFPNFKTIQARAENLDRIANNTYDIYISLRTYNSSFFNISSALAEAFRVLNNNGVYIISISNGFLTLSQDIIPGLIIPGIDFVDIYRGLNLVRQIKNECEKLGAKNTNVYTANTELYLVGTVTKVGE